MIRRFAELSIGDRFTWSKWTLTKDGLRSATTGRDRFLFKAGDRVTVPDPEPDADDELYQAMFPLPDPGGIFGDGLYDDD